MVQSIKVYDTNCYRSSEEREDNPLLLLYQYSLDFWKLLKQKKKELSCVLIMCVCVCVCVFMKEKSEWCLKVIHFYGNILDYPLPLITFLTSKSPSPYRNLNLLF